MIARLALWQRRMHEIVEVAPAGDRASALFDWCIITLILVNTVALALGTVETINAIAADYIFYLEAVSVAVFIVEYGLRVWACTAEEKYAHPLWGRLKFALTPLLLIDLVAILSFLLLPFMGGDWNLMEMRIIRLVARAARLGRYFSGIRTLGQVVANKRHELFTVALVLGVMLVLASTLMYYAEHQAQPEKFASIPMTMWWSIITLTTVGYGDVSPVTPWGQVMAGVIAVTGIGMFALPTGILGSGLVEMIERRNTAARECPHCGEMIDRKSVV